MGSVAGAQGSDDLRWGRSMVGRAFGAGRIANPPRGTAEPQHTPAEKAAAAKNGRPHKLKEISGPTRKIGRLVCSIGT